MVSHRVIVKKKEVFFKQLIKMLKLENTQRVKIFIYSKRKLKEEQRKKKEMKQKSKNKMAAINQGISIIIIKEQLKLYN